MWFWFVEAFNVKRSVEREVFLLVVIGFSLVCLYLPIKDIMRMTFRAVEKLYM